MDKGKKNEREETGKNAPKMRPCHHCGTLPPPLPQRPAMATKRGATGRANGKCVSGEGVAQMARHSTTPGTIEKGAEMGPPPLQQTTVNQPGDFKIVVDTREQTPLLFPEDVATVRGTLHTGDYSIVGYESRFTVERKSLADLVQTVIHNRARFERELARMGPFDFRRVIVTAPFSKVARGKYPHSNANPHSVIASIFAFEVRYKVPFVFVANEHEATTRVVNWARYYMREQLIQTHREMLAAFEREKGEAPHPPLAGSFHAKNAGGYPIRHATEFEVIPPKFDSF